MSLTDLESGGSASSGNCVQNSLGCLCGCAMGFAFIALRLSSLVFFITGLIFTIQEFNDIPDCADPYKAWSIVMVVLAFGGMTRAENESTKKDQKDHKALGFAYLLLSIFPGLVAGLGTRDVLNYPAESCDVSGISHLVTWTEVIIYFHWVLMGLLQLLGLGIYCQLLD